MKDKIRTPDGDYTEPLKAMGFWRELSNPLEELGFKVHGYDPGVSFQSACGCPKTYLQFSVDDLKILNEALKR